MYVTLYDDVHGLYRMCRVGQNHIYVYIYIYIYIYIRGVYGIFGRVITEYTVIYGAYLRFRPTLRMCLRVQRSSPTWGTNLFFVQASCLLWCPSYGMPSHYYTTCNREWFEGIGLKLGLSWRSETHKHTHNDTHKQLQMHTVTHTHTRHTHTYTHAHTLTHTHAHTHTGPRGRPAKGRQPRYQAMATALLRFNGWSTRTWSGALSQ